MGKKKNIFFWSDLPVTPTAMTGSYSRCAIAARSGYVGILVRKRDVVLNRRIKIVVHIREINRSSIETAAAGGGEKVCDGYEAI